MRYLFNQFKWIYVSDLVFLSQNCCHFNADLLSNTAHREVIVLADERESRRQQFVIIN